MNDNDFQQLCGSIRHAGEIRRGQREPEVSAKALLRVMDREPKAVLQALHA